MYQLLLDMKSLNSSSEVKTFLPCISQLDE
jgi:hypothetical protein